LEFNAMRNPIASKHLPLVASLLFFIGNTMPVSAAITPAKIFSDHMVLQRDLPVPIWGKADAGATVAVEFDGQTVETKAAADGRWKMNLKPMKANATGRKLVIRSAGVSVTINDVLVGEVWFSGGQSNMDYKTRGMAKRLPEGKAMVDAANFPAVRFIEINERDSAKPLDDLTRAAAWQICTPQSVGNHSAVAFVFAQRLHRELKVPVAVIDCSWGGTPIEPYIPIEAFTGHPTLIKLAAFAKAGNLEGVKALPGGTYARNKGWLAGAIYNGRIAPVAPYAIRGAIWYQGESNSGKGEDPRDYAHKMRALIKGWRAVWGQKDMPVYFVQLPQWRSYAWTYLREEQRKALDMPNTGMVVTIDLDNANDIHPPNKIDVGERLARWPLAKVYGRKLSVSGPAPMQATKLSKKGNSLVVKFDTDLMAGYIMGIGKIVEAKSKKLNGVELCGSDGVWHPAEAVIEGQTVVASSSQVKQPVAMRYACYPEAPKGQTPNLYNKAGLPASPFCTDWKLMPYDPAKNPM
jgi:sialate O-acetylesterase